jgi:hypothetical protein
MDSGVLRCLAAFRRGFERCREAQEFGGDVFVSFFVGELPAPCRLLEQECRVAHSPITQVSGVLLVYLGTAPGLGAPFRINRKAPHERAIRGLVQNLSDLPFEIGHDAPGDQRWKL